MAFVSDWKTFGLGMTAGLAAAGALWAGYSVLRAKNSRVKPWKTHRLTDPLSVYLTGHNVVNPVLGRLRSVTAKHEDARMMSDAAVGKLLTLLAKALSARKVIDVGVFTGCSAFSLALGVSEGGKVVACDVNEGYANVGRPFWTEGGVSEKIDLRLQPATKTLQELIDNGEAGTYDIAFIDADKSNYLNYYEMCVELLRPGGFIVIDNALWGGRVFDPQWEHDPNTTAICQLNTRMRDDPRVEYVLLSLSDGIGLAQKL